MTLIEWAVIVIAAAELFRCLSAGFASVKQIKTLSYFESEWLRMRERIGLGAAIGAGLGAVGSSLVEKIGGKGLSPADLMAAMGEPVAAKASSIKKGHDAHPDSRHDAHGQDHPGAKAGA